MDYLRAIEKTRDYCLQEITRRTPPRNRQDVYIVEVYERLIDDIDFRLEIAEMNKTYS